MYLNQFTNTKNSVQALSLHMTNAYSGYMLEKNQKKNNNKKTKNKENQKTKTNQNKPSNSFSSTKMT